MSVLSYQSIVKRLDRIDERALIVRPLDFSDVRSASIDLHLGDALYVQENERINPFDPAAGWKPATRIEPERGACWRWQLEPGRAYLGATREALSIPADLLGQLGGKSSVARLFVSLHQQAGVLDPGYGYTWPDWRPVSSCPTLEITCTVSTIVYPGQPIGQLVLFQLDEPTKFPYGHPDLKSHYNGDRSPQPARISR